MSGTRTHTPLGPIYDMIYDMICNIMMYDMMYDIISYIIIPKYQQFQFWLYQTSQKLKQEIHKQGEGEGGTCLQCAFKHLPQPLRTHI